MKFIIYVISILLLFSCSIYKPIEFKEFKDYSFSSEKGCNPICVKLSFYNPNFYNVTIKSAKIKAHLNNDELGFLKLNNQPIFKNNQESVMDLSINTQSKNIQPILSGFLNYFVGKDVKLSVDGSIKVKVLGFSKEIKIDESFHVER